MKNKALVSVANGLGIGTTAGLGVAVHALTSATFLGLAIPGAIPIGMCVGVGAGVFTVTTLVAHRLLKADEHREQNVVLLDKVLDRDKQAA